MKLTPAISTHIQDFLKNKKLATTLINGFGSPLNILFPEQISINLHTFQDVFKKHYVTGKVFYAHKPNKSKALIKQLSKEHVNIDVASLQELKSALSNGFIGSQMEATGPKNKDFLWLALKHNVVINIDNLSELEQIITLHQLIGNKEKTQIIVRLNTFNESSTHIMWKDTKFGIPASKIEKIIHFFKTNNNDINLKGFSFHFDTSKDDERIAAIEHIISLLLQCSEHGLQPTVIDIGGGFKVNYLQSEEEWNEYTSALKQSLSGDHQPLTWNNTGLGYVNVQGTIRGTPIYFDFYRKVSGAKQLEAVLNTKLAKFDNRSIAQLISENMWELWIEPGRALLDQVGITLSRINFLKQSPKDEWLIGLDMNRSNINSFDTEIMMDPIIISQNESNKAKEVGVYFTGNLCLEGDMIYRHKTFLKHLPSEGDIVVFINTAAYSMDFIESHTLQQSIAEKIVVKKQNDAFTWFKDSLFTIY